MTDRPSPTALDHLKFQRADWNQLEDFKRELDRSIEIAMEDEYRGSGNTYYQLGPELARRDDHVLVVVAFQNDYTWPGVLVMKIRPALEPGDTLHGTCELGSIVDEDWYVYGADLTAVHRSGLRLSWPTPEFLHRAARHE